MVKTKVLKPDAEATEAIEAEGIIQKANPIAIKTREVQEADPNALSPLENIWKQRHSQRKILFYLSVGLVITSFLALITMVIFQAYIKLHIKQSLDLFPDYEFQIISAGVFAEVIGVVNIIAKSIWNDETYKDSLLYDHKSKHKEDGK